MKHLENFKSENIQDIYNFLEQDADVTNFKRDLIAVAEYKKVGLHDLEAELYQYADLMKEDLKDKITFVFREDGYLGMFGEDFGEPVRTMKEYTTLKTGDKISVVLKDGFEYGIITVIKSKLRQCYIQYYSNLVSGDWILYTDSRGIYTDHEDLRKYTEIVENLITNEKEIKELKETMHFALVI